MCLCILNSSVRLVFYLSLGWILVDLFGDRLFRVWIRCLEKPLRSIITFPVPFSFYSLTCKIMTVMYYCIFCTLAHVAFPWTVITLKETSGWPENLFHSCQNRYRITGRSADGVCVLDFRLWLYCCDKHGIVFTSAARDQTGLVTSSNSRATNSSIV